MSCGLAECRERYLPIFPLKTVLFPGMRLSLHIFEERYKQMIRDCLDGDALFGVTLIRRGREVGGPAEPHLIGTTARITHVEYLDKGEMDLEVLGERRFQLMELQRTEPYLVASVHLYDEFVPQDPGSLQGLVERAKCAYRQYLWVLKQLIPDLEVDFQVPQDAWAMAHFIASHLDTLSLRQRQMLLEIREVDELLSREIYWLTQEDRRMRITLLARDKIREIEAKYGHSLQERRWLN